MTDTYFFIGTFKQRPDKEEYDNLINFLHAEIERAGRRVAALKHKKGCAPEWKYFDEYAGDYKTIDILIEEWEAILWALNSDLGKLTGKFNAPRQIAMEIA